MGFLYIAQHAHYKASGDNNLYEYSHQGALNCKITIRPVLIAFNKLQWTSAQIHSYQAVDSYKCMDPSKYKTLCVGAPNALKMFTMYSKKSFPCTKCFAEIKVECVYAFTSHLHDCNVLHCPEIKLAMAIDVTSNHYPKLVKYNKHFRQTF